jgi:predicted ATP-grasp superfamily ATP-dependent carboligase
MPRVLLTDGQERATLAAARCLHGAGYTVAVAGYERGCLTHVSRSCDERLLLPSPARAPREFAEALPAVVAGGRYDVLVPGSDAALRAIVAGRARLEPQTRIGLPDQEVVERTFDRLAVASAAAEAGLEGPPMVLCRSPEHARQVGRELGFPLAVKTRWPVVGSSASVAKVKSRIVTDEGQLLAAVPDFGADCLMQALVLGPEISCGGVMTNAGLLGLVVSRYVRTWPVRAGDVSFSTTISPPEGLTERVQDMMRGLGWTGIFELELIRVADGAFAAIDLNPRVYGSLALSTAAGVGLAARWCGSLLGVPQPFRAAPPGISYRREDGDLAHALWQLSHGHLRAAGAVVRPRPRVTHALLGPGDPGPILARGVSLVRSRARRLSEPARKA